MMNVAQAENWPTLSNRQAKLIKSLRIKKHRDQEKSFVVEGEKNVLQLLDTSSAVQLLVGTPVFLTKHAALLQSHQVAVCQLDACRLAAMGSLVSNNAALAVVAMPQPLPLTAADWGLVLDDISDPGNLGTIMRIADWYAIPTIVCSPTTVDAYNPKVIQASMGSWLRVHMHYTPLETFLAATPHPVWGTFTNGPSLYQADLPDRGWIVIGNESRGISDVLQPHINHRVTIPRRGAAESLNAATATAILCDRWRAGC